MSLVADIRDSTGKLILSKDDLCLVNTQPYVIAPTVNTIPSNSPFSWEEELNYFQDAETGATNITANWLMPKASNWDNPDLNGPIWFSLGDGSSILLIGKTLRALYANTYSLSFAASKSGNGIKLLPTFKQSLNQYKDYFNAYDSNANLLWSVGSIIQAPKILTVAQLLPTMYTKDDFIKIDLSTFNVDINKCYLLAGSSGRISADGTFFNYVGTLVKRSGNFLYMRGMYRVGLGPVSRQPIKDVFGKEGIYITIAYMPNG